MAKFSATASVLALLLLITHCAARPIGSTPPQMRMNITKMYARSFEERENENTLEFNSKMKDLLKRLQAALPGSKFAIADLYPTAMDIFQKPQQYGFAEAGSGRQGTEIMEEGDLCNAMHRCIAQLLQ